MLDIVDLLADCQLTVLRLLSEARLDMEGRVATMSRFLQHFCKVNVTTHRNEFFRVAIKLHVVERICRSLGKNMETAYYQNVFWSVG